MVTRRRVPERRRWQEALLPVRHDHLLAWVPAQQEVLYQAQAPGPPRLPPCHSHSIPPALSGGLAAPWFPCSADSTGANLCICLHHDHIWHCCNGTLLPLCQSVMLHALPCSPAWVFRPPIPPHRARQCSDLPSGRFSAPAFPCKSPNNILVKMSKRMRRTYWHCTALAPVGRDDRHDLEAARLAAALLTPRFGQLFVHVTRAA